ncbi:MAG: N-acetyl-gamma-glutamyl-phosphate reductase [Bryobacteraceae bacterium]
MTNVGIAGYRGYSGAELVRILKRHPHVTPILLDHRDDGASHPIERNAGGLQRVACTAEAVGAAGIAVVFLATPADVSMELAPALLATGAKVIDLSGAFRLGTPEAYAAWYKETHTQPALLAEAVYGLPEFCRQRIPSARLVANPGCYPTAANLAIRPLVAAGVVHRAAGIVCDAKSGVSGAGRKPSLKTHFCEVAGNFSAYSVLDHRHVPEVLAISGLEEREFSFTAQLLPVDRGILETIYFRTARPIGAADLMAIYARQYAGEPFIRLYPPGHLPDLHAVVHTNNCDIGAVVDESTGRAVVVSAIDNLVKGAAGQAVQNMNLMLGYPEAEGLL